MLTTSRLESEIQEARLKAKEEMMQGILVAKEMAQQELISQKEVYESKIKSLEAELVNCCCIIKQKDGLCNLLCCVACLNS